MLKATCLCAALAVLAMGGVQGHAAHDAPTSIACAAPDKAAVPEPLRFAILPDRTGQERPGVFERAMLTIGALQPQFVLSVGDLIEGYTDDPDQIAREWDEVEAQLETIGAPVCAAPGNHDIWDAASGEAWDERRGARHYAFVRGGALFLVLDTEDPPVTLPASVTERQKALKQAWARDPEATQQRILDAVRGREPTPLPGQVAISSEQVDWAVDTIREHVDVRWTFVIMHKPAWREDPNPLSAIEAALAGRNFTMIAGHEHYFETEERDGADYLVTGTAGGVWLRDGEGRLDHVLLIEVGEERDARPRITSVPLVKVISH